MNKKGFAISVILYVIVFLIIAVLYVLLGIVKSRYNVSSDLKNSITNTLNGVEYIYGKLDNDGAINVLKINPNGGSIIINGEESLEMIEIVKYANDTLNIPMPSRENTESDAGTYTLSYNSDGGNITPNSQTVNVTSTTSYTFDDWILEGDCGEFVNDTYTFPSDYGTTCTLTASWKLDIDTPSQTVIVAGAVSKLGNIFNGWKSSADNNTYQPGSSYILDENTVMTAQWTLNVWANLIEYNNASLGCHDAQCAIDRINEMLR